MTQRRADRLNSIVAFLHERGGAGASHLEIANFLGLKKTAYSMQLITEVISKGWARGEWDNSGKWPTIRYFFVDKVASEKLTAEDYGP